MTETIIELETEAIREALADGERWIKGAWGGDGGLCLHGAVRRCQPQPGDAQIIQQVADLHGWGTKDNDEADTTWDDVKGWIVDNRDITDQMLLETFGPQWEHIVALVRRVAVLTDEQSLAVVAVWDDAWAAAWDATRAAAWGAAGNAAGNAARNAAWNAAWGASRALAVRDLISPDGFTQEHYNTLTGPLASVIGPIHPNDVSPTYPKEHRHD